MEGLIACKVEIVIAETMQNTEEEIDTCGKDDEFLTSHLASFKRIEEKKKSSAQHLSKQMIHKKKPT